MHSYQPQWPAADASRVPLSPADFVYRDASDVARFAAQEPLTTWYTWPDVWHLDDEGRWQCCSRGSSLDSVRRFAQAPRQMLDCRLSSTGSPCPNNWLVLEPRHPWNADRYDVTEEDAAAFLRLRSGLAACGVTLLDVVVFDQACHWWSLSELTSGSTAWAFGVLPNRRTRGRATGR
ncbi:MAG TPA: hypothetical protein VH761_11315 [Ilumatobacteraceae bacterium]